MQDLAISLRAKLDEIGKDNELCHKPVFRHTGVDYYDGAKHVIESIRHLIDSRPDDWHDLREEPGDLPIDSRYVWVVVIFGNGNQELVEAGYFEKVEKIDGPGKHWLGHGLYFGDNFEVVAWHELIVPTIPARFQAEEKV